MASRKSSKSRSQRGGKSSSSSRRPGSSAGGKSASRSSTKRRPASSSASSQRGKSQTRSQSSKRGSSRPRSRSSSSSSQQGVGAQVVKTVKDHPIATAAIGTGVALLAATGVRKAISARSDESDRDEMDQDSRGARDQSDDEGEDAEASDNAGEEEGDESEDDESDEDDDEDADEEASAGKKSGRFGWLKSALGNGYERGRDAGSRTAQSHPLAIAGAALASGAILGLLLPRSRSEDSLLGRFSDRVAGRVKKAGKQLLAEGRLLTTRAIRDAASATADEAERVGLTPDRMGRKIKRVASRVRDAVTSAVQDSD